MGLDWQLVQIVIPDILVTSAFPVFIQVVLNISNVEKFTI